MSQALRLSESIFSIRKMGKFALKTRKISRKSFSLAAS